MDLREILREAGVEEKAIKQILTTMKAEKIYTTNEENADIRIKKFKEKQETLEEEINEKDKKIEGYKTIEADKEKISNELEALKKEAADKEFNTALDNALKEAKSKNNKLVKSLLDNEKLTLKDGKLEGLEEQLEAIKKENDFLFDKPVTGIPDFGTGGKGATGGKGEEKSVGSRLAEQANTKVDLTKFL